MIRSKPSTISPLSCLVTTFCLIILSISVSSANALSDVRNISTPKIHYHIKADVELNCYHVALHVDSPGTDAIDFAIPAWTPGFYQILNYQANIDHVAASCSSNPVIVTHPSSRIWEAASTSSSRSSLDITYDVHCTEDGHGFFSAILKPAEKEGYINGAAAFMYIVGHNEEPATLTVTLPPEWKIATPLTQTSAMNSSGTDEVSQTFIAENYDELIDCPLQMGRFDETIFKTDGILFRCILLGNHQANKKKLNINLGKIAHAELQQFGYSPFQNYIFFFHCGGAGFYGGLEHRSSTVIHLSRPIKDAGDEELLAVAAHELFHAWNVKRLRPQGLGPFDYTQQVRTRSLWWAEGVTDYFAELMLVRSGLRSKAWFLDEFSARISELDAEPARVRISLEEASLKAWEGRSEGFGGLSYYLKGSLAALYFDLRIRELTNAKKGLEDALIYLEAQYAADGNGYPETALLESLNLVSGTNFDEEYAQIIGRTDDIDWKKCLSSAGIVLKRDHANIFGIELEDSTSPNPIVRRIEPGFPGDRMGLKPGDKLLSMGGRLVVSSQLAEMMSHMAENSVVKLRVERAGAAVTLEGHIGIQNSHAKLSFIPENQLSDSAVKILSSIFGHKPDHPIRMLSSPAEVILDEKLK